MSKQSKCFVYEWRTHEINFEKWKSWCNTWGKSWVFQLEKGEETEKEHYQGLISLKTKRTKGECLSVMSFLPEHFAPLSNNCIKSGSEGFYQTKPDTRIEGPWKDSDVSIYIPRQYRGLENKLYEWQETIWDSANWWEDRIINVIIDPTGNKGKSTIAALMELHGRGIDLPPTNDKKELIQSLADILIEKEIRTPRTLFIDIPRSDKQDKLYGLYAAIEQIKKGKVVDTRYKYKEWWFDSPVIWVFCNTIPHKGYVSSDRWKLWEITDTRLQEFKIPEILVTSLS